MSRQEMKQQQPSEWDRISDAIDQASEDEFREWQATLTKVLFDCGFGGKRKEFKRLTRNAYMKFRQYRSVICDTIGVESDEDINSQLIKQQTVTSRKTYHLTRKTYCVTCIILVVSVIMLLVGIATLAKESIKNPLPMDPQAEGMQ